MKNAAIYTRSASPNEQAIKMQLEVCRDYAQAHGYKVVAEFTDNGYSGMNFDQLEFISMNNDCGKWKTLIVYSIDRISRNSSEFFKYRKILLNKGIEIISIVNSPTKETFELLDVLRKRYAIIQKEAKTK